MAKNVKTQNVTNTTSEMGNKTASKTVNAAAPQTNQAKNKTKNSTDSNAKNASNTYDESDCGKSSRSAYEDSTEY